MSVHPTAVSILGDGCPILPAVPPPNLQISLGPSPSCALQRSCQQILLALPSKYTLNPTPSHHPHCLAAPWSEPPLSPCGGFHLCFPQYTHHPRGMKIKSLVCTKLSSGSEIHSEQSLIPYCGLLGPHLSGPSPLAQPYTTVFCAMHTPPSGPLLLLPSTRSFWQLSYLLRSQEYKYPI